VDGKEVIKLLSGTIFDCLIYKGYGQRVSERDHRPGGFSLELGLKDVSLVSQAARECNTPMPFLSVLLDRFVSAKARGRGGMDWSAIGMCVSENAGKLETTLIYCEQMLYLSHAYIVLALNSYDYILCDRA
jgi:3-hydroxyisobutyrate dehydrogenase-like beta-hydroxyacid dehydrogenase